MGAFSGFLIAAGVLTLFSSAISLGLTFLHSVQGDPWAPVRTGYVLAHYISTDLGIERLLDWVGMAAIAQMVMDEPFYRVLFVLGIIFVFLSFTLRAVSREA
jgi:hypothetical protein